MKKLVLILVFAMVAIAANAQTKPTEVAPDGYITKADYEYVWGTTADTLTNADTLTFVYRVKGLKVQDFKIWLYSDWVSGTAGGTLIPYISPDGVNYQALGDTITVSSLTADALDSEYITFDNFMNPYLKLIMIQTGTAVTVPKAIVYTKQN